MREPIEDVVFILSDHVRDELTKTERRIADLLVMHGLMHWDGDDHNTAILRPGVAVCPDPLPPGVVGREPSGQYIYEGTPVAHLLKLSEEAVTRTKGKLDKYKSQRCFDCPKGTMHTVVEDYSVTLPNKVYTVQAVPRLRCSTCGEELFDPDSLRQVTGVLREQGFPFRADPFKK